MHKESNSCLESKVPKQIIHQSHGQTYPRQDPLESKVPKKIIHRSTFEFTFDGGDFDKRGRGGFKIEKVVSRFET